MSIFGSLFDKNDKKNTRTEREETLNLYGEDKSSPFAVFTPSSFDDVSNIIDALKSGKAAVVHLDGVKEETALRITDMLSGAVYALKGGVYEMQKNTFMFSPSGIEMH